MRSSNNLIGTPENISTKFGLLKVVLRELSSVELEGTEIFKKIEGLIKTRGGSRAAAISKMERFVIIVNGCKQTMSNNAYPIMFRFSRALGFLLAF